MTSSAARVAAGRGEDERQHRAARSDGRRAGALSAGGGVVGHHRGRVGRGSRALKNGLNHGRAGVAHVFPYSVQFS